MWWPDQYHQFCWAHLKRDVTKISERSGDSERIGLAMLQEISRMFIWWHRVRDGTLARWDRSSLHARAATPVEALLAQGAALPQIKARKTCKKLLKHAESLWTFVYIEGVEPTNNRAEQAVRHGVILRKSAAERTLKLAVSSSSAFSPCMPHYANNSAPFSNSYAAPVKPLCSASPRRRCCLFQL